MSSKDGIILGHNSGSSAAAVREWLDGAHASLQHYASVLNDLNVFPVADSDTGYNLAATMGYAAEAGHVIEAKDVGELLLHAGRAALEEARGNSGVLAAVTLVAMGSGMEGTTRITATHLKNAMLTAHVRCCAALTEPVAGTMISVLETASQVEESQEFEDGSRQQLADWLDHMVERCTHTVIESAHVLPALAGRRTVDSGALGLLIILAALRSALAAGAEHSDPVAMILRDHVELSPQPAEEGAEGHEVVCSVELSALDAAELRTELDSVGTSVIVSAVHETDQGYAWRVHVHVDEPEVALNLLRKRGKPKNVSTTPLSGPGPESDLEGTDPRSAGPR